MKPILFNTEMVRALLDGRKTATRRIIKLPPCGFFENEPPRVIPPYQPGEILYVRETWAEWTGGYVYRADDVSPYPHAFVDRWRPSIHMPKEAARIFLRVTNIWAERLQTSFNEPTSPILAVREEGVDIGDTCRECIEAYGWPCCVDALDEDGSTIGECGMLDEARGDFSDLWDSTIKPADRDRCSWAVNPWVWVIEFEQITKEEALAPCVICG